MSMRTNDLRQKAAALQAEQAFWAEVARLYPEARDGDFPPASAVQFSEACVRAVAEWCEINGPAEPPCGHPDCVEYWQTARAHNDRPWCIRCSLCQQEDCHCGIGWQELTDALRARFGEDRVTYWNTGGGNMNPVIVLKHADHGDIEAGAIVYVMFTMGWHPDEASFSLYNEADPVAGDCGWRDENPSWAPSVPSDVPTTPEGVCDLVERVVGEWLAATAKAQA